VSEFVARHLSDPARQQLLFLRIRECRIAGERKQLDESEGLAVFGSPTEAAPLRDLLAERCIGKSRSDLFLESTEKPDFTLVFLLFATTLPKRSSIVVFTIVSKALSMSVPAPTSGLNTTMLKNGVAMFPQS
jgi:hypothetical protein